MKIKDYKFIKKFKSNSVTSNSPETKSEASSIFDVLEYYQNKFKYICIFFIINRKQTSQNEYPNISEFIRRKSCECTAWGGSKLKLKKGHLIVLENEVIRK